MRTISANQGAILRGGAQKTSCRIWVKDAGGTFRNLATYALGVNLIESVSWGEAIDGPGIEWTATFIREQELNSLAPLMQTSGLNHQFDISATYAPLFQVGRQVKAEWAIQAEDDPQNPTWVLAFTGYLDDISWADDVLTLTGRGDAALLVDTYIERERVYAYAQGANADRGCYVFQPSSTYAVGDRVIPTSAKVNNHFYRVTSITTGVSASSEPTWPIGGGAAVTSGGVTFTESGAASNSTGTPVETVIQQILNDNLGVGTVVLSTPVSPGWAVRWFMVSRQLVFDELRQLADQIGWCLRPIYDSGSGTFKLTFYDPNRSNTTSARTFQVHDIAGIKRAEISIFDIRSTVQVVYSDSQDIDASGNPIRKVIRVTDSTSLAKYGNRFCEIAEDSASNIDTADDATTLANSVLEDLREPLADFEITTRFFPFVELTDVYTLAANGVHFDVDQKLAVIDYHHNISAKDLETTIRVRGRPASGSSTWLQRSTDANNGVVHQVTALENTVPLDITLNEKPIGGVRVSINNWNHPRASKITEYEFHVSDIIDFVPSTSTVVATGKEMTLDVGHLNPARPYYGRVVPLIFNDLKPIRSGASEQLSFTPGRAYATHLNSDVDWGNLPLNGSFETQFDEDSPPDFWELEGNFVWNTHAFLEHDNDGKSGGSYLRLATITDDVSGGIISAYAPIEGGEPFIISVWKKCISGSGDHLTFTAAFYDSRKEAVSHVNFPDQSLEADVGAWAKLTFSEDAPANARFVQIIVGLEGGAADREVHLDSIAYQKSVLDTPEINPVAATLTTTFTTASDPPGIETGFPLVLTMPDGVTPIGIRIIRAENLTSPSAPFYEAVTCPAFTYSGTSLSLTFITGLAPSTQYRLTIEVIRASNDVVLTTDFTTADDPPGLETGFPLLLTTDSARATLTTTFTTAADPPGVETTFPLTLTMPAGMVPTGLLITRAENLTAPSAPFYEAVTCPAFTYSGTTLTLPNVTGLAPDTEYRLTVEVFMDASGPGTLPVDITPTGLAVLRIENLTNPSALFESAVTCPAFTYAGTTLSIPYITGLSPSTQYRLVLQVLHG